MEGPSGIAARLAQEGTLPGGELGFVLDGPELLRLCGPFGTLGEYEPLDFNLVLLIDQHPHRHLKSVANSEMTRITVLGTSKLKSNAACKGSLELVKGNLKCMAR